MNIQTADIKKGSPIRTLAAALAVIFSVGFFSSCSINETKAGKANFSSTEAKALLESRCFRCHAGSNSETSFSFIFDETKMVENGLISSGDAEDSILYQKLTSSPPYGSRMPKSGDYLSDSELAVIADWIRNISPTIAITSPSVNSYIDSSNNSTSFPISGSCSLATGIIDIYVDGAVVQSGVTCTSYAFSTTIDSTGLSQSTHTLQAKMKRTASSTKTFDSSILSIIKDLTSLSISLTSHSNFSATARGATGADSSLITTSSANHPVAGTCNANGRTVLILLDGTQIGSTSCNGTSFTTVVDNSNWTAASSTPTRVSGAHMLTARYLNPGGATVETSVSLFKSATSPTVSFTNDIQPLLTIPRSGNSNACIDCHYKKTGGAAGSASFTLGYWSSCSGGGKPDGSGNCSNTTTVPAGSSERSSFVFQMAYDRYTNVTPTSNEGVYTMALTIVNNRTDDSHWIANRIVRGNPEQSFVYRKVAAANALCYNGLATTAPISQDKGCKTSQATTHAQMPNGGPNYLTSSEQTLIFNWIIEGARTDN